MSLDLQASALRHEALLADRRGRLRAAERGLALTATAEWSGGRTRRAIGDRPLRAVGGLRRLAGAAGTVADGGRA